MKKLSLVLGMFLFLCGTIIAQRTITGTVTNDVGKALSGASVLVKNSTIGTVTDIDGRYSLDIPAGEQVLVFNYTGYATKEVKTSLSNIIDIVLSKGVVLTEVVVSGLSANKRTKILDGSGTKVIVGDYSYIRKNQPLYVIDGIPFNTNTDSVRVSMYPNDITDISILKGMDAIERYGEAGRNGVILVTTKNGKGKEKNKLRKN